jgi:cytochrome c-type biogenesis protein CcmH/NrfF
MRRALPLVALTLTLLLAGAPAAALASPCPKTTVADLEDEVMCPVCGTTLALAREAPLAKRERVFITELVRGCKSKQEIKQALLDQFGPTVLALPQDKGFDATVYVLPIIGGIAAAGAVTLMLMRWRRRGRREHEPVVTRSRTRAEDLLLEAELDRLR